MPPRRSRTRVLGHGVVQFLGGAAAAPMATVTVGRLADAGGAGSASAPSALVIGRRPAAAPILPVTGIAAGPSRPSSEVSHLQAWVGCDLACRSTSGSSASRRTSGLGP